MTRWHRFLDALLGPRCTLCGTRVFPRDRTAHETIDHAGDRLPRPTTTERTPRP